MFAPLALHFSGEILPNVIKPIHLKSVCGIGSNLDSTGLRLRGSVATCLTHHPGVLDSRRTGFSLGFFFFFRESVLRQNT